MNFNMFRLIYDYAIATLKMSMPLMEMYLPEQAVDDLETLHSLGLFDLDPEGVALVEGKFTGYVVFGTAGKIFPTPHPAILLL